MKHSRRLSDIEKKQCLKKVQSHMTMKEVKPYVTSLSSSVEVSELEVLLGDA